MPTSIPPSPTRCRTATVRCSSTCTCRPSAPVPCRASSGSTAAPGCSARGRRTPDYWPAGFLFQAAIDAGLAVASIDYRHSREAPFPAQLHDAKAAIRYLRRFAGELGLDPERFGVWGESAGGHLAALVALIDDPAFEGSDGVVGPEQRGERGRRLLRRRGCRHAARRSSTRCRRSGSRTCRPRATRPPPSRSTCCSRARTWPRAEGRRLVSPVTHVTAGAPPFLLVHGETDGLVPIGQSEALLAALQAANVESELVRVPGADHVFLGTDPVPQLDRARRLPREKLTS